MVLLRLPGAAQQPDCLHGRGEAPRDQQRRQAAFAVARSITVQEHSVLGRGPTDARRFRPLAELKGIPATPDGFQLQLLTDGESYSFFIRDGVDPCYYTIFSDQDRDLYEATPTREGGLLRIG